MRPPEHSCKGQPCQNCGKRPATGEWVGDGGTLGYVHGMYAWWCDLCMVNAQIEYAEKIAAKLPGLRARREELCDVLAVDGL